MKFEIRRTSYRGNDDQPDPAAKQYTRTYEALGKKKQAQQWEIELDSLDDLMTLVDESPDSQIVVGNNYRMSVRSSHSHFIEIYDSYRE